MKKDITLTIALIIIAWLTILTCLLCGLIWTNQDKIDVKDLITPTVERINTVIPTLTPVPTRTLLPTPTQYYPEDSDNIFDDIDEADLSVWYYYKHVYGTGRPVIIIDCPMFWGRAGSYFPLIDVICITPDYFKPSVVFHELQHAIDWHMHPELLLLDEQLSEQRAFRRGQAEFYGDNFTQYELSEDLLTHIAESY